MNKVTGKKLGLLLAVVILPLSEQSIADNGFYVGGALGKSYIDEIVEGTQFDADGTSFRISAGYEFNDNFGIETSYIDLGEFDDSVDISGQTVDISARARGFSVAAVGALPLGEQFSAKARVGYYFNESKTRIDGVVEDNDTDQNPFVGVGLAYDVSENVQLSFDVDYFDMDGVDPVMASVGVSFRF